MTKDPQGAADAGLLDVKLLRLLDLIHSTRSVTRAADELGQSQPTVSIWLAKLRLQLNDPLFVRTTEGMQPTPRADELVVIAREVLQSLRKISSGKVEFDATTAQRTFRICMTDASHVALLPQLLAHVRALAPGIRLVATRIDEDTARAMQSGDADLAIGFIPWLEAGFYQQVLFTQDWVCLANGAHPRIGDTLTLDAFKAEEHVAITGGTGAQLLDEALRRMHVERRVILELPGFLGLSGIVSASDLIAVLPRHIANTLARFASLRVLECPMALPTFTVKQHWHARFHQDSGNRWMRGVVAGLFLRGDRKAVGPPETVDCAAAT